ncbi:AAA family ATPase [Thiothrix winogradskyi]|uniref:ATP-binding protein n=1 Tax=Thiothrix winogradskyi TaxID=96472 RepID=A0ABY3SXA0_9GAMM|nr:AAA family ATPase [Thiothrix winogradskyi]UJS23779.1 ATP-binding protein [Thiothrix winogradskyi]
MQNMKNTSQNKFDISMRNIGPIKQANIELGNLTVLVGPQATGKSIFLQTLKLLIDRDYIDATFKKNSMNFKGRSDAFLDGYFGRNMSALWKPKHSDISINGQNVDLIEHLKESTVDINRSQLGAYEQLFYIPAQRVISLPRGMSQDFGKYHFGDPFTLRHFSDRVHSILQNKFAIESDLSPHKILPETIGKHISEQIYAGAQLTYRDDEVDFVRKLMLDIPNGPQGLPFLAWSAGQREFTPLLLGLYLLFEEVGLVKEPKLPFWNWVVIEEPEMGLHPQAINITLYMILTLLARGHKVLLSTHSPQVLDMLWALRICQQKQGTPQDVLGIFNLEQDADTLTAELALKQQYKVYYFQRSGIVEDISALDPGSDNPAQAHWGGLTEFAGRAGDVVSQVVNRAGF